MPGNIVGVPQPTAPVGAARIPAIYNVSVVTSGLEYSQVLSESTKKFAIKCWDQYADLRLAYASGQTIVAWIDVKRSTVFGEDGLDLPSGFTLYFQSNKPNVIVEIREWK